MNIPQKLLKSLVGIPGYEQHDFLSTHLANEQITSIRLNPSRNLQLPTSNLQLSDSVPWSQFGYYLDKRPSFTFDPLFHAGCYYVQEASSMFVEQALKQTTDLSKSLKILDLCAAPGGKSTHIQSLISKDSLLVSNEAIRSRVNILKDNIIKWGTDNVIVTNNDPEDFSNLEGYFDIIVIDAPCSGSGLFRKDPSAIEEWSEQNVLLCSKRQQRILADVFPALKNGGVLIYSTCSYSKEEDEDIINWVSENFPVDYIPLQIDPHWSIVESGSGYRFWPDKLKGEGFFISCFRKTTGENFVLKAKKKLLKAQRSENEIVRSWIRNLDVEFIKKNERVFIWPSSLIDDFALVLERLRVIYSGVFAGDIIRDQLVPDHALAMSGYVHDQIIRNELEYESAIAYLQRKIPGIEAKEKGWQLVTYQNSVLGWIKILPGRINNYYPRELRIIKDN